MGNQCTCPIHITTIKMGHPEHIIDTPFITGNSTTKGIINSSMSQKLSNNFGMYLYWMQDRIKQGYLKLIQGKGLFNMADYFTKSHPPWQHWKIHHKHIQCTQGAYMMMVSLKEYEGVLLTSTYYHTLSYYHM